MQQQASELAAGRTDHFRVGRRVPSTNTGNGSKDRRWPAGLGHRWGGVASILLNPQERHPLVKGLELVRVAVRDLKRIVR